MTLGERIVFVLRHPRRAVYQWWRGRPLTARFVYVPENVAPQGPLGGVIAYHDQRVIRECLTEITRETTIRRALEVGCGYGRLTMVLGEFADEVIGVEREPHLAEIARSLLDGIEIRQQDSILTLPTLADGGVDLAMTFTVFQHMVDEDVRAVLAELRRVVGPRGFVLLVEKVEPGNETRRTDDRTLFLSKHRPVAVYQEWMAPFTLVSTRPRPAPAAWGRNSGAAMLFRGKA